MSLGRYEPDIEGAVARALVPYPLCFSSKVRPIGVICSEVMDLGIKDGTQPGRFDRNITRSDAVFL